MAWWTRADEIYERRRRAVKPQKPVINKGVQHRQLYRYYLNLAEKFNIDPETLDYESVIDVTEHYDTNKRSVKILFEETAVADITEQVEHLEGWVAMMEAEKTEVLREQVASLWRELDRLEADAKEEAEASIQIAPAESPLSIGDRVTHVWDGDITESGIIVELEELKAQVEWDSGGRARLLISKLRPEGEEGEPLIESEVLTETYMINTILKVIKGLEEEFRIANKEEIISVAKGEGIYPYMTEKLLEKLKRDGNIYEPRHDVFKVV